MAIQTGRRLNAFLGVGFIVFALIWMIFGSASCQKAEEAATPEEGKPSEEGRIPIEGTVKVAVGKYVFIPEIRGFDIIIQGSLESGDIQDLVGKQVRGEGETTPERPSVLVADILEVKQEDGTWMNVFTRTEDVVLEDYLGTPERAEFDTLQDISYNKKETWEGREKAKVYGRLEKTEAGDVIVVLDDEGKQIGKVLVDGYTDFAQYYVKKLRLFDKFWFYVRVKETVDWRQRRRTRELFHADVLGVGLF